MKLHDFLNLFDNLNGDTTITDDDLFRIVSAKTVDIIDCIPKLYLVKDYDELFNMEVVSFGFYDNELCVRVKKNTEKRNYRPWKFFNLNNKR